MVKQLLFIFLLLASVEFFTLSFIGETTAKPIGVATLITGVAAIAWKVIARSRYERRRVGGRTLAFSGGIAYSRKVLCNYRYSPTNISSKGNTALRFKAVSSFENWLYEFIGKLDAEGPVQAHLLGEIQKEMKKRVNLLKGDALLRSSPSKPWGIFVLITNYLRLRRKYSISPEAFARSMVSFLNSQKKRERM